MTPRPVPAPGSGVPLSSYRYLDQLPDPDGAELREWVDSVEELIDAEGHSRARRLLLQVLRREEELGLDVPTAGQTDYVNTIPVTYQPDYPGDEDRERRIRHYKPGAVLPQASSWSGAGST